MPSSTRTEARATGADPWRVPIAGLGRAPGRWREEHRSGPVGELAVAGTSVNADAEASVDAELEVADGGILVVGTVRAPWVGQCRRCLTPVTGTAEVEVRELYRRFDRPAGEEEAEETYELSEDWLDLQPLVRDALLLELPLAPLCRPDCAGLCPTCGADRNDGDCGCPTVRPDPRWAGLDALADDPPST
jgi:uncharacterized protein